MELKKSSDITWNDLPKIENPFFARSSVEEAFHDRYGVNSIWGLDNFLYDSFSGGYIGGEAGLKYLLQQLEEGSVFLLKSRPFSPLVIWKADSNNADGGEWVIKDNLSCHLNFEVTWAVKRAEKPVSGGGYGINSLGKSVILPDYKHDRPLDSDPAVSGLSASSESIAAKKSIAADEKNQSEAEICPYCGKPNEECNIQKNTKTGNNIGKGSTLTKNIFEGRFKENHPWYTGPNSLEAHHIICSEAMNNSDWATYCNQIGYDINRKQNGVMLPYEPALACQLHAPLHRGNHQSGYAYDLDLRYPDAVMKQLKDIEKKFHKGKYCNLPAETIIQKIDMISSRILNKIDSFLWTITSDGRDYKKGGCGCGGNDSIKNKVVRPCPVNRDHQITKYNSQKIISKKSKPLSIGE